MEVYHAHRQRRPNQVKVDLGERSYRIEIGPGLLDEAGRRCRAVGLGSRPLVVTDEPSAASTAASCSRA